MRWLLSAWHQNIVAVGANKIKISNSIHCDSGTEFGDEGILSA